MRLAGLGAPSVTPDEAISAAIAASPFGDLIRATTHDLHPPLHYLALHASMRPGNDEFALRFLSAEDK